MELVYTILALTQIVFRSCSIAQQVDVSFGFRSCDRVIPARTRTWALFSLWSNAVEFLQLLKPPLPTDPGEICQCTGNKPVKLMCALSYNPIHCIDCNLEVDPSRLQLTRAITQGIAYWCGIYSAIDLLWLDSGKYEEWAKAQLSDICSPVNRRGLDTRASLDQLRRCYYWFFQDQSVDDFEPVEDCPKCGLPFSRCDGGVFSQFRCENCSIITIG
jgi:hypothetical protein